MLRGAGTHGGPEHPGYHRLHVSRGSAHPTATVPSIASAVPAADKSCSHIKGRQRGAPSSPRAMLHHHQSPHHQSPTEPGCCRLWGEQPRRVLHRPRAAARSWEEESSLFLGF